VAQRDDKEGNSTAKNLIRFQSNLIFDVFFKMRVLITPKIGLSFVSFDMKQVMQMGENYGHNLP
jgi:hypothetical protein